MPRKIIIGAMIICIVSVFCGCDGRSVNNVIQALHPKSTASGTTKPQMSPKATMQNFINRCQASDVEGVKRYFCRDLRRQATGTGFGAGLRIVFRNCRITDVEESYGAATVYVRIQNPVTGEWQTIPFPMVLEDGEWKISEWKQGGESCRNSESQKHIETNNEYAVRQAALPPAQIKIDEFEAISDFDVD